MKKAEKQTRRQLLLEIAGQVMPNIVDATTFQEARDRMRPKIASKGCRCELCGRHLQVYPRVLSWAKAFAVTALYRQYLKDGKTCRFYKLQDLMRAFANEIDERRKKAGKEPMRGRTTMGGGEPAQAFIWGLIDKDPERRGYFQLTWLGVEFAEGVTELPEVAVMFCGEFHSFAGKKISIAKAYKKKFDEFDLSMPEFLRAKEAEAKKNVVDAIPPDTL
jgi:hypothetical protein